MSKENTNKRVLASTWMGAAAAVVFNSRRGLPESVEPVSCFVNYALGQVDARGDRLNYPSGRRSSLDKTLGYYHPEMVANGVGIDGFEKEMAGRLESMGIPATAAEWFVVNLVWEHIMGGGSLADIPEKWRRDKYLRVEVGGKIFGYPKDSCLVPWSQWGREEQIYAYRMVTGYRFTETFLQCMGNGYEQVDPVFGAVTIYQIMTDRYHKKNVGEPLFSELVDIIGTRCKYGDLEEALAIGRLTGIWPVVAILGTVTAGMLCRLKREEEWLTVGRLAVTSNA